VAVASLATLVVPWVSNASFLVSLPTETSLVVLRKNILVAMLAHSLVV
jgi:hypothetical protein